MSRRSRAAFTLVELLVVITVIAMLMALLIPAASMVIEGGRRTQCLSNVREIATASNTYETAKSCYPPWRTDTTAAGTISWAGVLLPNVGRGDLGEGLRTGSNIVGYVPIYVCPSNPPDTAGNTPALGYAANAGGATANKTNGVFMDYMKATTPREKVTRSYVFDHDGVDTTVLAMECLNAKLWSPADKARVTIVAPMKAINDPAKPTDNYISSKHGNGANVAYCGTNTQFLSDNVDKAVLELIMTPYGKGAGQTATLNPSDLDK